MLDETRAEAGKSLPVLRALRKPCADGGLRIEREDFRERGQSAGGGGEFAKEGDRAEAGLVEGVVDVLGEVGADGFGGDREARGPFVDEVFDVLEAVVAGELEVVGELGGGDAGEEVGAAGPDGGDPGEVGAGVPLVGEVEVLAGCAEGLVDGGAVFEGEEGGVADEEGGVGLREHGDRVGGAGEEGGVGAEEVPEEDLGVGDGRSGGGVGGYGLDGFEGETGAEEEKDGADAVEGGNGAAGDDGEVGGEGGDWDEAEGGSAREEVLGALGWGGVVKGVAGAEVVVEGWVFEVPHEGGWVEEVDGGYGEAGGQLYLHFDR